MKTTSLAAALLLAAACAPDRQGDLRGRVAVHPAGAPGRMTFDGVGPGSAREEAVAAFGDDLVPPARAADFGTRLRIRWDARFGPVHGVVLAYEGNPRALAKVADRWQEVFREAGADCGEGSCYWRDGDDMLATMYLDRRWWGAAGLTVSLDR